MPAIRFQVVHTRKQVRRALEHVVILEPTPWDDYGVRCSFVVLVASRGRLQEIGTWKIVNAEQPDVPRPELPTRFTELPAGFVALGQQVATYQRLSGLAPALASTILRGLHDIVFRPVRGLENQMWFQKSLARFAAARAAIVTAPTILAAAALVDARFAVPPPRSDTLDVGVRARLKGFSTEHSLNLSFVRGGEAAQQRRIVVIVGPNGTGKTQLLAALARSLSGLSTDDITVAPDKPFSLVIAVSYGAFDHFLLPRLPDAPISYVYCGLRVPARDPSRIVLDIDQAIVEVVDRIEKLSEDPARLRAWGDALEIVQLAELRRLLGRGPEAIRRHMREQLSAGQKLVALTISNLAAHLQTGAIVLHDEPETHLHPNMLSALLRAVHMLLDRFASFGVIATHSVLPAQETPASNVVVLDRHDDETAVRAFNPPEQCFAATLDEVTRLVFRTGPEDQNFRVVLDQLQAKHSTSEIREILGGNLGLGVELLLTERET